jgi:hypothetical protein
MAGNKKKETVTKTDKIMKKLIVSAISFFILTLWIYGQQSAPKPFSFKSAIIEYKYSGDKAGESTQYVDDYGMKNATYTEMLEEGETVKGWTVSSGDYQYMWDLSEPTQGMKMKNPLMDWIRQSSEKDLESFTIDAYEKMGMIKSGKETFLGKECTVIKGEMGKVLIWNGILMFAEFKMGSYVSRQEAISVKTNIPVDGKYFVVPKDITFSEMPGF